MLTWLHRGDYPNPNGWSALRGQTNGAYMVREPNQIKFGQGVSLPLKRLLTASDDELKMCRILAAHPRALQ